MTVSLISIFDNASESYDTPRAFPSKGAALRALTDMVRFPDNGQQNVFRDHAEHFSAFYLGEFDQGTGQFFLTDSPELLCNLWELKVQK